MTPLLVAIALIFVLGFAPAVLLFFVHRAKRGSGLSANVGSAQKDQQAATLPVVLPPGSRTLNNVKVKGNAPDQ